MTTNVYGRRRARRTIRKGEASRRGRWFRYSTYRPISGCRDAPVRCSLRARRSAVRAPVSRCKVRQNFSRSPGVGAKAMKLSLPSAGAILSHLRRPRWLLLLTGVSVTASALGGWHAGAHASWRNGSGPRAKLVRVIHSDGPGTGVVAVAADGSKTDVAEGADVPCGTRLETNPRARARLELADGTVLALDRASHLLYNGPRDVSLDIWRPRRRYRPWRLLRHPQLAARPAVRRRPLRDHDGRPARERRRRPRRCRTEGPARLRYRARRRGSGAVRRRRAHRDHRDRQSRPAHRLRRELRRQPGRRRSSVGSR